MPILSFEELAQRCRDENKAIYEIAQEEEAKLLEDTVDVIRLRVTEDLLAMKLSIKTDLNRQKNPLAIGAEMIALS